MPITTRNLSKKPKNFHPTLSEEFLDEPETPPPTDETTSGGITDDTSEMSADTTEKTKTIDVSIFNGEADKLDLFFIDLDILFRQRPNAYLNNEQACIDALYSHCSERVKKFLYPILSGRRPDIDADSFKRIREALTYQYHNPQLENQRNRRFADLKQTTTVEALIEKFEELAPQLEYPVSTWGLQFKGKLKPDVQDSVDMLALDHRDYAKLKNHALAIDQSLQAKSHPQLGFQYKVNWVRDYGDTWEPIKNLYCPEKIQAFHASNPDKPTPGARSARIPHNDGQAFGTPASPLDDSDATDSISDPNSLDDDSTADVTDDDSADSDFEDEGPLE